MVTIRIPTARDFWRAVCLFAYRRWSRRTGPETKEPTDIPHRRDPEAPCNGYAPRPRDLADWPCQGDGHYLCEGCAHHVAADDEDATEARAA